MSTSAAAALLLALLDAQDADLPRYVVVGQPWFALQAPSLVASLDGLGEPRLLPPLICGRYAVAGQWDFGGVHNVFTGTLTDGEGGGALGITVNNARRAWTRLIGTNTFTGPTTLDNYAAATITPGASLAWSLGSGALLCVDADQVSDGNYPWTAPAAQQITYADGTGTVYVDGALTVTSGAAISVTVAPPYRPTTLLEARGGLSGTFAAGTLPAGWHLVHTATRVLLDAN